MLLLPQGIRGVNQNQSSGWNHSVNAQTTLCWPQIPELKATNGGMTFPPTACFFQHTQQISRPFIFMLSLYIKPGAVSFRCTHGSASVTNHRFVHCSVTPSCLLQAGRYMVLLHNSFPRSGLCFASFMHVWLFAMRSAQILKPQGSAQ